MLAVRSQKTQSPPPLKYVYGAATRTPGLEEDDLGNSPADWPIMWLNTAQPVIDNT